MNFNGDVSREIFVNQPTAAKFTSRLPLSILHTDSRMVQRSVLAALSSSPVFFVSKVTVQCLKTTITKTFMKASATRYSIHLREPIPKRHNLLRMFSVSLSNRRELKVSVSPQIPVLLFPALFSMDSSTEKRKLKRACEPKKQGLIGLTAENRNLKNTSYIEVLTD